MLKENVKKRMKEYTEEQKRKEKYREKGRRAYILKSRSDQPSILENNGLDTLWYLKGYKESASDHEDFNEAQKIYTEIRKCERYIQKTPKFLKNIYEKIFGRKKR